MPREIRRHPSVPNWLKTPQRAAIGVHSGLDLGPTLMMNRKRLRKLELTVEGLEQALINIEDAKFALEERRDEHYRHYDGYGYGDESVSDDKEEASETARCDQILQTIIMSDRERITEFVKAHTKSDVSVQRMILDAARGVDFDVLEEYLDTKITRARMRLTDVHKTFVSEFEASVKADSLPFLTELHSAIHIYLPTELRNMIYACLLPIDEGMNGNDVHFQLPFSNPDFHANTSLSENDDYHSARLESEIQTTRKSFKAGTQDVHKPGGWLLNSSYVGKDMARNLAEIYYSSYGFELQMQNMKSFLYDDRTETGFKPVEHIRKKLDIFIQATRNNGRLERAWASTDNETEFLNRIYFILRDLLLLSHIREIPIIIRISTCSPSWAPSMEGDRRFYNVMEAVREPIYDLLHNGVDLEVWHVASASNESRLISKEPWNFFSAGKELWQDERQTHGPSWRPSSNFVTKEDCQQDTLQQLLVQRWGFTESIDSYGGMI